MVVEVGNIISFSAYVCPTKNACMLVIDITKTTN
jgi:hypothetical protein